MRQYTNNGTDFLMIGATVRHNGYTCCCVTESWLLSHGYGIYTEIAEDGTDGMQGNKWIHYTGKPEPKPEPKSEPKPEPTAEEQLIIARNRLLSDIQAYDMSPQVNIFTIHDIPMWLDKATRNYIKTGCEAFVQQGKELYPLWYDGKLYQIACTELLYILSQIEAYAVECFNATSIHLAAADALTTIESIKAYDYTADYPTPLNFPGQ